MGLVSAFNVVLHCPLLTSEDAKHVLRKQARSGWLEPAVALLDEETPIRSSSCCWGWRARRRRRGADGNIPLDRWITCMEDLAG